MNSIFDGGKTRTIFNTIKANTSFGRENSYARRYIPYKTTTSGHVGSERETWERLR
jgi:hypothetical protein